MKYLVGFSVQLDQTQTAAQTVTAVSTYLLCSSLENQTCSQNANNGPLSWKTF